MTSTKRKIGFRRTEPWGGDPKGNPWTLWVGALFVSRLQPWQGRRLHVQVIRDLGYVGVSAFGVCVSVTR